MGVERQTAEHRMLLVRIRIGEVTRFKRRLDGSGGCVRMLGDRTGGMRFAPLVERDLIVAGCRVLVRHVATRVRVVVAVHRAIGMLVHVRMRYRQRRFAVRWRHRGLIACFQCRRFGGCITHALLFVHFAHACLRYPR